MSKPISREKLEDKLNFILCAIKYNSIQNDYDLGIKHIAETLLKFLKEGEFDDG